MTVEEFLERIINPDERNPGIAKEARKEYQEATEERISRELSRTMPPLEAQEMAAKEAKKTMSTIAAFHNPDLTAGGRDVISDFGDRQVNSTIGPQWRTKIPNLKEAAEAVPAELRSTTRMNVKLHKC